MKKLIVGCLAAALALPVAASAQELTIYSGRGEALVAPIIAQFQRESGIDVNVRYAGTAELAALLQEEGEQSPADVFWAQDGGALGAIAPLFADLPAEVNEGVAAPFRNVNNKWAPTSGRSRVLLYSTERVEEDALPASVKDLVNEEYRGRVAWAPTNGSFQAFVTAMRVAEGDEATKEWLEGMIANEAKVYRNNGTQVEAVANGEVDFGLVNNYYLGRYLANDEDFPVAQTHFEAGDIGNLLNVAGVGIVAASDNQENARTFIDYLLSVPAQQYITLEGNEYPVVPGLIGNVTLEDFDTVLEISPEIDIDQISDLDGTLELLREVGLL
ncbi:extracellular solute-binding protein [Aliihoeflea aestuarii]|jgi:iron(III) transport system substrate-binding protein|uniref:iron ABC transporter substrate-binding protein n=1 Tax=Aliihoeflea aestuarii TaxID=453840 RepID=UPI002093EDBA|nr:iron ABC transporter substrate-binding protein [Aliihoeflea aestuarii]MCO6389735.1 extracellular solute-binding protein [Aliihoeflea aestuarii]